MVLLLLHVPAPGAEVAPGADAASEQMGSGSGALPWHAWDRVTGDIPSGRSWLEQRGIALDIDYAADYYNNAHGGLNTSDAHVYRGILDIALTWDTEVMGLWKGGTFFVDFQQIHGRDISQRYVGDLQALNNADAPDRTQVAEYWFEQKILGDGLRLKLGKMDANADFAYVDYGFDFTFQLHRNWALPCRFA